MGWGGLALPRVTNEVEVEVEVGLRPAWGLGSTFCVLPQLEASPPCLLPLPLSSLPPTLLPALPRCWASMPDSGRLF